MGLSSTFIGVYFLFFIYKPIFSELQFYDAVVVEVVDTNSDGSFEREKRQSPDILRQNPTDILLQHELANNPLLIGPCLTSKGILGRCMSFRQCYPNFNIIAINNWPLGTYDTCSYITQQGRQMIGVCCTGTIPVTIPDIPTTTRLPDIQNTTDDGNSKNPFYPQVINWPPPIPPLPTHSPDNTIPPLPTHAPPNPINTVDYFTTFPPPQPVNPVISQNPPDTTSHPPGIDNSVCGAKNGYQDQERIVGGHNADLGEWPWIAALFNGGRQFCGGSLIDDIHILSAAHCVAHMTSWDVARLTVRLGDHNIKTNSEIQHIEKKIKRVVRHRGFDFRTLYNDVAILTLDSSVTFSQQIRPICLPQSTGETYAGKTATVIGWGSIRESGPQPPILQEVNIPIWSNQDCRLKYGPAAPGGIVEHMLCAGQDRQDSCSGDSGGPLMVNAGKWIQVGIVSWGIGCGKGQYPGVYTRVQTFLPWIHKNLK